MKLHCYLIGAEVLQTLRQLDFLLVNLDTMLFLAGSCNLFGGYRTEGSSALSCLDLDHDLLGLQLCCQRLCRIQILLCHLLFVCLMELQVVQILGACLHTDLLR